MACASTIYTNLDTVMLGFMKTNQDVGYYNASVRIKTILVSLITSLGAVLLPRASYYVENKLWDEFKNISEKALNFVFTFGSFDGIFWNVCETSDLFPVGKRLC